MNFPVMTELPLQQDPAPVPSASPGDELPPELLAAWHSATTHAERARIEEELIKSFPRHLCHPTRGAGGGLAAILGTTYQYGILTRRAIRARGPTRSAELFALVESGELTLIAAGNLARRESGRRRHDCHQESESKNESEIKNQSKLPAKALAKKKRSGTHTRRTWSRVRSLLRNHVERELAHLDAPDREAFLDTFDVELRAFTDSMVHRVRNARERSDGLGTARREVTRKLVLEACLVLGLDAPRPGRRVDLRLVNRNFRRLSLACHPDVSNGDAAKADRWRAIREAKEILDSYDADLASASNVRTDETAETGEMNHGE